MIELHHNTTTEGIDRMVTKAWPILSRLMTEAAKCTCGVRHVLLLIGSEHSPVGLAYQCGAINVDALRRQPVVYTISGHEVAIPEATFNVMPEGHFQMIAVLDDVVSFGTVERVPSRRPSRDLN